MNATPYISSGILERHLVGLTSEEEVRELEEMISQYPEIKDEMQAIQKALHGYVLAHQVLPPDGLRQKIIEGAKPPPPPEVGRPGNMAVPGAAALAQPARDKIKAPPINWWIVATAALALATVALGVFASKLLGEVEDGKTALAASEAKIGLLKKEREAQISQYEKAMAELDLRSDHDLTPIRIKGTNRAPGSEAIVYWNGKTKKSYIDVRKLPDVPEGQQLQLWVTANGQTENLGTPKTNKSNELPELKFIENPSLYFVTLEKAGPAPKRPNRWRIVMGGDF